MAKALEFETSTELKRLFNAELDAWRKRFKLSLDDLSRRCGVSQSYLAHIGRYGRVPSKPVLILLAINFEISDPAALFRAAGIKEPWPFEGAVTLAAQEKQSEGFLSVKLDMGGFVDAIRSVVRAELKPRTLHTLLGGRPLRIGANPTQSWLFGKTATGDISLTDGIAADLYHMLQSSLQCEIETILTPFSRYIDKLSTGEIDIYGPMMSSPHSRSNIIFSLPVHRLGMSMLFRERPSQGLPELPPPTTIDELITGQYRIAVIRDSRAHLVANTHLKRSDHELLICTTDDEAVDRITLKGVARPAHVFLCNSVLAHHIHAQHREHLKLIFASPETIIDMCDNAFAIRPDWADALPAVNDAIRFIMSGGGLRERMESLIGERFKGLIELPSYSQNEAQPRKRPNQIGDKRVA
jgi:transcriptional regulator with XRE-family HTH domain